MKHTGPSPAQSATRLSARPLGGFRKYGVITFADDISDINISYI